jgi:hypothetical protein
VSVAILPFDFALLLIKAFLNGGMLIKKWEKIEKKMENKEKVKR